MADISCNSDPTAEESQAPQTPQTTLKGEDYSEDKQSPSSSDQLEQQQQQQQQRSLQRTWESRVHKKCGDLRQLFDLPEGEVHKYLLGCA